MLHWIWVLIVGGINQICSYTLVLVKTKSERHAILSFIICSLAKVCIVILSFCSY